MRISRRHSSLVPLLLFKFSSALQVSPSSPCSTQCIDDLNNNPADPNSSNTLTSDLTCNDADYNTTVAGQKFKSCLSCLQTSTYSASTESDQLWFLYNLRYTLAHCLFGYPKNSTTIGGPCLTEQACGTFSSTLESGILNPSLTSVYDYCSSSAGGFKGEILNSCTSCLSGVSDKSYLSNFVIALRAACEQKPAVGTLIGLSGTVFNSTPIAIAAPSVPATSAATSSGSSGLSVGAKAGIIAGSIVAALIILGAGVIWWKKRHPRKIESRYDSRFGAPEISAPTAGAYTNRHSKTPANIISKYNPADYQDSTALPEKGKIYSPTSTDFSSTSGSQPNSPPANMPVHPAYLPNVRLSIATMSSSGVPSPPNSGKMRKFSLPFGPPSPGDLITPSPKPSPTVIPRYDPSTYVPGSRNEAAQSTHQQPQRLTVPSRPRDTAEWSPSSPQSVEQWPGSM